MNKYIHIKSRKDTLIAIQDCQIGIEYEIYLKDDMADLEAEFDTSDYKGHVNFKIIFKDGVSSSYNRNLDDIDVSQAQAYVNRIRNRIMNEIKHFFVYKPETLANYNMGRHYITEAGHILEFDMLMNDVFENINIKEKK